MTKLEKAITLLRQVEADLVYIGNVCNPQIHEKLRTKGIVAWHRNLMRIRKFLQGETK